MTVECGYGFETESVLNRFIESRGVSLEIRHPVLFLDDFWAQLGMSWRANGMFCVICGDVSLRASRTSRKFRRLICNPTKHAAYYDQFEQRGEAYSRMQAATRST